MADRISFPYERALTPIGFVWIPVARVQVLHRAVCLELEMTVDTGADLTMIPYQIGLNLGLRRGLAAPAKLSGIAGTTSYFLKKISLRIGPIQLNARCAWAQTDDVPTLLGRTDVLDQLVVTFDGLARRVTLRG